MPILLAMSSLQKAPSSEEGGLLRVLLLWESPLPIRSEVGSLSRNLEAWNLLKAGIILREAQ